jgi:hypothetical protein
VYDARIAEAPLTTLAGYWHVLGSEYAGPAGLVGNTSIRGWTRIAFADVRTGDAWWAATALLLLAVLCGLAWRDRSRPLEDGGLAVPAMFSLWSLLVIYHNGNNLILLLPAFAFLWCRPGSVASPAGAIPLALVQAALMFDVPVRLAGVTPSSGWERFAIVHFDRLLVIGTLASVAAIWCRLTATPRAAATPFHTEL